MPRGRGAESADLMSVVAFANVAEWISTNQSQPLKELDPLTNQKKNGEKINGGFKQMKNLNMLVMDCKTELDNIDIEYGFT